MNTTHRILLSVSFASVLGACGGHAQPAQTAAPAASSTEAVIPAASAAPAATATAATAAPAADTAAPALKPTGLTKEQLADANAIVMSNYPKPFAGTYKLVVAKIGEPKKKSENMYEWFAVDNNTCVEFSMTKDAKKGHAAGAVSKTEDANCK